MENSFDLLMENASHFIEFLGDTDFAQPVGERLFGGGTQLLRREQKSESAIDYLVKAFLPSAHWWSLE